MAKITFSFTELGKYVVGLTHYGYDKSPGPDIVAGLEHVYADVLGFIDNSSGIFAPHHPSKKSGTLKERRRAASLFLLWQSLYNGFTSIRKGAWTEFWGTLPFGGHHGANQYPGSGFSAFVYLNAPRYKAGLDLLLDPPIGAFGWDDNFESYPLGLLNGHNGWVTPPGSEDFSVVNTLSFSGTKCIASTASSSSSGSQVRRQHINNLLDLGHVIFTCYFYSADRSHFNINFWEPADASLTFLLAAGTGSRVDFTTNTSDSTFLLGLLNNAWNKIELEIDPGTLLCRFQVNSGGWSSWKTYVHNNCKVLYLTGASTDICYYDDLSVTPA